MNRAGSLVVALRTRSYKTDMCTVLSWRPRIVFCEYRSLIDISKIEAMDTIKSEYPKGDKDLHRRQSSLVDALPHDNPVDLSLGAIIRGNAANPLTLYVVCSPFV